ncbi:MAG: glycosyltransferase family 39 protein [Phycisphaerae bacterium]
MFDATYAFRLLRRLAAYRVFWLGGPLLLIVWSLGGPFLFDDIPLLLKCERFIDGDAQRLDLFRFAANEADWQRMRDRGTYPWWSPEHHRIDFFRPLAEGSFYLDVRLFGRFAPAHRLVSFLWFAAALLCVHRLARLVSGGDSIRAGLTAFFFGISQTVTQPATFICNRNDLLVIVGVTIAASCYWSAGTRPRRRLIPLAACAFAWAILSKESGVVLAGIVGLFELIHRHDRSITSRGRLYRRIVVGTLLLIAVVYVAYYLGTRASQFDMATAGAGATATILKALQNAALYASVWTAGFPISALIRASDGPIRAVVVAGLVGVLLLIRPLLRSVRGDRGAHFFVLWAVLFMLPALLVHPETRALSVATIGWTYLLAAILVPGTNDRPAASAWLRQWLLAVNGIVSVCCVVGTVLVANRMETEAREQMQQYVNVQPRAIADGDALIVVEASSAFELLCAGDRLEYLWDCRDVAVAFLTIPGTRAEVTREDDHTLLLTSDSPNLFDSPTHRLTLGPAWKPEVDHIFRLRDFRVEIAALRDDGTVGALRVRFDDPLNSQRLHFYPPDLITRVDKGREP